MIIAQRPISLLLIFSILFMTSCGAYYKSVMFKTDGAQIAQRLEAAQGNYKLRVGDYMEVFVYTNEGERIVDPNYELQQESGASNRREEKPMYLVRENGFVKLPLVGDVALVDKTLYEADSLLEIAYGELHYVNPFVLTKVKNKRIFVLGPEGGKVIPMENENMNLIEVLALYEGIDKNTNVTNIRLIRGDLDNPEVTVIDLGTIEGMKQAGLSVQANDIVYIEPIRKIITESFRDAAPVIGVISNILTLAIVIIVNSRR